MFVNLHLAVFHSLVEPLHFNLLFLLNLDLLFLWALRLLRRLRELFVRLNLLLEGQFDLGTGIGAHAEERSSDKLEDRSLDDRSSGRKLQSCDDGSQH